MNPYHRYELDPGLSVEELTEEFRERMDRADSRQREEIRTDWESLTMDPRGRVAWAIAAFPARVHLPSGHKNFRRGSGGSGNSDTSGNKAGEGGPLPLRADRLHHACKRAEARLALVSMVAQEMDFPAPVVDSLLSDPLLVLEGGSKPRRL